MAYARNMFSSSASFTERDIRGRILVPGLQEEVEDLNNTFISIQAVLSSAEKRQLKEEPVRVWVERLRDISDEIEDVLDVWKTVHLKLQITETDQNQTGPSYCSWLQELAQRGDLQGRIVELKKRLDGINQEKEAYKLGSDTSVVTHLALQREESSAFDDVPQVFGRDQEIQLIKAKLLTSFSQEMSSFDVVSIVGMGGVGKTTIALRIFNEMDDFVQKIWVCVSNPFDKVRVAKSIVEELGGRLGSTLQSSLRSIRDSISGKKFMLVLDDVWSKDSSDWTALFNVLNKGAPGSKILVTSRNKEVGQAMDSCYSHDLEKLSEDESWKLFRKVAFSKKSEDERQKLEQVGKSIAEKCKGLPLALKTLASHLKFKAEREWHKVVDSELWELEAVEEGIFVPLLFSYYELPLAIKKCFSYCAIFPKDYLFIIEELIWLWMSQGYLNSSRNGEDMETVGEEYFQHLVTQSFFQDLKLTHYPGGRRYVRGCKMHDIVHDFAQFLSKDRSLIVDTLLNKKPSGLTSSSSSCRNLRHLTVLNPTDSGVEVTLSSFSRSIQQKLLLHTFRIPGGYDLQEDREVPGMFQYLCFLKTLDLTRNNILHLCFLKALDLNRNNIKQVPEEIGQLVHLRYLDLSGNSLNRLPETICELCNLQTLLLDNCFELKELPRGIGKLVNLRHLKFEYSTVIPKGIGGLSSLRTLPYFSVGRDKGYGGEVAATIGDLRNLNNLQGKLSIRCLNNVKDGEEARKAELRNKKVLTGLKLSFFSKGEEDIEDDEEEVIEALEPSSERLNGGGEEDIEGHEEEVIEALEPSCHSLETLNIFSYGGKLLPSWIGSLSKLRILYLTKCEECLELPPLGQLPSLEKLEIWGFGSCTRIGEEFLGIKRDRRRASPGGRDGTKTTSSSVLVAFPKLKVLKFFEMALTEWEDNISTSGEDEDEDDEDDEDVTTSYRLFPCLEVLKIKKCWQLKSLPQFLRNSPIQYLRVKRCPILQERCYGEDWSKISHIPNIVVTRPYS